MVNAEIFCEDISCGSISEKTIVLATLEELSLDTSDLFDAFIEDIIVMVKCNQGTENEVADAIQTMKVWRRCFSAELR